MIIPDKRAKVLSMKQSIFQEINAMVKASNCEVVLMAIELVLIKP
jgi:hypothetical protein